MADVGTLFASARRLLAPVGGGRLWTLLHFGTQHPCSNRHAGGRWFESIRPYQYLAPPNPRYCGQTVANRSPAGAPPALRARPSRVRARCLPVPAGSRCRGYRRRRSRRAAVVGLRGEDDAGCVSSAEEDGGRGHDGQEEAHPPCAHGVPPGRAARAGCDARSFSSRSISAARRSGSSYSGPSTSSVAAAVTSGARARFSGVAATSAGRTSLPSMHVVLDLEVSGHFGRLRACARSGVGRLRVGAASSRRRSASRIASVDGPRSHTDGRQRVERCLVTGCGHSSIQSGASAWSQRLMVRSPRESRRRSRHQGARPAKARSLHASLPSVLTDCSADDGGSYRRTGSGSAVSGRGRR